MKLRLRIELGKANWNKETGNYKYHMLTPQKWELCLNLNTQQNKFTNPGKENDSEWTKESKFECETIISWWHIW
jgi:hypothetical protein